MQCPNCNSVIMNNSTVCPSCGAGLSQMQGQMSEKNRTVYAILGFFFGYIGIHDFYLGRAGHGVGNILGSIIITPFLTQVSTGIEILTVTKDNEGRMLQGGSTAAVILGILTILLNLALLGIIVLAILGCAAFA